MRKHVHRHSAINIHKGHISIIFIFDEDIDAETKWTQGDFDVFRTHHLVWKLLCFDSNVTEIISQESNNKSQQYSCTGTDNGLVPSKYTSLGINNLNSSCIIKNQPMLKWTQYVVKILGISLKTDL